MRIDRRVVVPALAALSVTALGVSVALLGSDPDAEPRALPLASSSRTTADAALGAPTTESGYTPVGTLPSGRPDDAPAWDLPSGPAAADRVQALARAFKAGLPERQGDSWRAGGLTVNDSDGQSWWWSPCPDGTVSSDGEVRCATAVPDGSGGSSDPGVSGGSAGSAGSSGPDGSGGGTAGSTGSGVTTPEPPPSPQDEPTAAPRTEPVPAPLPEPTGSPVPEGTVTTAARPVLEALGLSLSDAKVQTTPYGGTLTVTPEVGDVEAWGFDTRVDVAPDGTITSANGWLATPDKGDTYPLITAQEAFEDLPARMVAALCPIGPDGKGCLPPEPAEVTGARVGLSLQSLRDGSQLLVPSWLFTLKGSPELVPVVAVQAKYLDTGSEPGDDPVPSDLPLPVPVSPSTGTGGGTEPGSTDPGAAREQFSFDAAWRGDTTSTLVVRYGDSSSCVRENVTHAVKESADSVVVFLEADAREPGLACTDDYRAVEVVVRLAAPLGDRTVVDGASGKPVALTTS